MSHMEQGKRLPSAGAHKIWVKCVPGQMHARHGEAGRVLTIKGAPEFRAPQPFPPQL